MFGCGCLNWNSMAHLSPMEPDTFSLPASIPDWPQGQGFATGRIKMGKLEVAEVTRFEFIWGCNLSQDRKKGVSFYRPIGIPDGFFCLGHYCQSNDKPLHGFVLVVKEPASPKHDADNDSKSHYSRALVKPLDYALVWSSDDGNHDTSGQPGNFWLPQPPSGYEALGFIVANKPDKPDLEEVRCVRADLIDNCQACGLLLATSSRFLRIPFRVWKTRPYHRGMLERGVPIGTFFCGVPRVIGEELHISCLKNLDPDWHAMPNVDQIHALIHHYGPTVFFHPTEKYLPSSVSWFFENGACLCRKGKSSGEPIDPTGSNLPCGGANDGEFWLDLPSDDQRETVKCGHLDHAELYVHVKPAMGGTFTDIAMWVFFPFNGPATLKVGPMNIDLNRIGGHVGDWEHFTLRISNFTGKLYNTYFSQHSGGVWVNACDLEYIEGNRVIVYSSKSGHASFPHPGYYLQGSLKLGIGIRNDCARSNFCVDSSVHYQIVAAEYLGDKIIEPSWLQFMRKWGPAIVYDLRTKLDKIIQKLPLMMKYPAQNFFKKFPVELYGEDGPTGPKEKNNWVGDERW